MIAIPTLWKENILSLTAKIQESQTICISTHTHCDGDGLGAELALYYGLLSLNKKVDIIHTEAVPKRYLFLDGVSQISQYPSEFNSENQKYDLSLILDTNDSRLLLNLFPYLEKNSKNILFIDHHQNLSAGPHVPKGSWIQPDAASTGELIYFLLKQLNVQLTDSMAQALYTSIAFDTQVFKFVRKSSYSYDIASHLMKYNITPDIIHRHLFGSFPKSKLNFFADALKNVQFFLNDKLAILFIRQADFKNHNITQDQAQDFVDFIIAIEDLEYAVVLRELPIGDFKASFRSRGLKPILPLAEKLGGGGHLFAAGATLKGTQESITEELIKAFPTFDQSLAAA